MFFSVKPRISDLQYFVLISCFAVGVFSGCDTFTMKDKTPDSLALRPAVDPMTLKASVMLAADKAFADIAASLHQRKPDNVSERFAKIHCDEGKYAL
jgi:hypothetical protein